MRPPSQIHFPGNVDVVVAADVVAVIVVIVVVCLCVLWVGGLHKIGPTLTPRRSPKRKII